MAEQKTSSKPITIHIMGNEYHVASPEDEVEKLQDAARALDKRMCEIKENSPIMGLERIAVMSALNLSYELMHGEGTNLKESAEINERILKLQEKIDGALTSTAQSDLI